MTQINPEGMKTAALSDTQFTNLREAEKKINETAGNKQEIYLLAVTRDE
ncbi:MAG: Uncharacterized protein XD97_0235 [Pelotomaculum thermopropionicum]|uniref:Uncharacterized protein n=1 Tax=Pelotomaculum thermopropionicum TaxID=110500 RepID=A0A124FZ50_9FIRM|nr:MAG: Uncharacterized protein XD97_0235 [Pelotomaculum thermopropionicum]